MVEYFAIQRKNKRLPCDTDHGLTIFLFSIDWFELSYKGREAGQLLLQLTYYSHVSMRSPSSLSYKNA